MGTVVNPVEFRLDTVKNWENSFFVSENYAYVVHQQHVLRTAIYSSLRYLDIKINKRFRLSSALGVTVSAQHYNLTVVIKWKLYWRNILRCIKTSASYFAPYRRYNHTSKRGRLRRRRSLRYEAYLLSNFKTPEDCFSLFYKQAFKFFYFLPLVDAYKKLLTQLCTTIVPNTQRVNIILLQCRPVFNAKIILAKLAQRFRIRKVKVGSVLYYGIKILNRYRALGYIKGYKLMLNGRFSRRDRATYTWKSSGNLPYSSKLAKIVYGRKLLRLRYSCCVIKLWVCLS